MPTPLPVIANTFRCAFNWTEDDTGQTAVNVMHFHSMGTATDVFNAIASAVGSDLWSTTVPGAFVRSISITPLDGTTATSDHPTSGAPSTAPWAGSTAGDFVPAVAVLVKLQTGIRGRPNRGRVYLPFTSEGAMSDGKIGGGLLGTLTTGWSDFLADLGDFATPAALGVAAYDRKHDGAAAHFNAAIAAVPELAVGSQRKRQTRVRG